MREGVGGGCCQRRLDGAGDIGDVAWAASSLNIVNVTQVTGFHSNFYSGFIFLPITHICTQSTTSKFSGNLSKKSMVSYPFVP